MDGAPGRGPRILPLGDTALSVEFGSEVDRATSETVMALDAALREARIEGVVEMVPSFRALMVVFDPLTTDGERVAAAIRALQTGEGAGGASAVGRAWRLPVAYGGAHGPDLEDVAARTGLAAEDVISRHSATEHQVYMIGFLPGHPYLGDLPSELTLPRRATPRVRVPRGSVAIAVGLSVIYPVESPGGWHLIGHTPVPLFDPGASMPALLAPGDRVVFTPVAPTEHDRISDAIAAGEWIAEREALA